MPERDEQPHVRPLEQMRQGWADELKPLEPLDVTQTDSFDKLLAQMSRTAFAGRGLGEAADVLYEMVTDEKCFVVMTLSGAIDHWRRWGW